MADDTMQRPQSRPRTWLWLTAKLALVAGLTWLAVRGIAFESVGAAISRIPPLAFLLALGVQGLALLAAAARWQLALSVSGLHIPPRRTVRIFFVSSFFGTTLPAGVGQDVIRIYSAAKGRHREGGRLARSAMSVVIDRIAGLAAFALLSLPGLAVVWHGGADGDCPLQLAWLPAPSGSLLVPAVVGLIVIVFIVVARRSKELNSATKAACSLAVHDAGRLLVIAALSIFVVALTTLLVYVLGRSLTPGTPLREYLIFVPLIALLAQLPISILGLGVREAGFVLLFACGSANRADVLALSLACSCIGLVASLVGGVALLTNVPRDERPSGGKRG